MALITTKEVFDFMGTDEGQRTKHGNTVANLIERKTADLEATLRRKLTTQTATSQVIYHGNGCTIYDDELFLKGAYRDFYSITALTETGTSLTESTAYNDGNDYVTDYGKGILKRVGACWPKSLNAFVITGSYGYLNSSNTARKEVLQILIEMVAAASGLWTLEYQTDQGTVRQKMVDIRTDTKHRRDSHINYTV